MPLTDLPRIQPHDLDAEQAILGAVLINATALAHAQEILKAGDFYDSRHRDIFEAMTDLAGTSVLIDLLTVGDWLDRHGRLDRIGGRGSLAEVLTTVSSAANITHHARIVSDHAIRRRLIKRSTTLVQMAYEKAPTEDLLREVERGASEIAAGRDDRTWQSGADIARETADYVDRARKQGKALIGIPTGFATIDTLLGGWQRSDLVIIAARPSMGKTSLAIGSALAAAHAGYNVGILSLEMSSQQIGLRVIGMAASIDVHTLKTGTLRQEEWWHFANTAQEFEQLPFWADDSTVLTVEQVAAKARHLKATKGLDLLVVDYLQLLLLPGAETRQQGIADASRRLKLLAKELDIPVLALSQLSRACEQRPDKRPMLADLRDSGAIEQDADVVLFLYRHEVYVPDTDEKGVAEVLIRKHRNGPIGDRRLKFIDRFARFEDIEP
ncbi:replicative DNA helicase [Nitrospira lenta]|uniref:Replicative DNA helicase n=1 Tax=Nitrospira lenta TaxID=1436998 RepID=A0A330L6C9_9BACT|nr:replicative DNA helicase [Nitrospira lenta]SPP64722.1 Replicative DNA helicase [Nitrospira lenta]